VNSVLADLQTLLSRLITAPDFEEALAHEGALRRRGLEMIIAGSKRLSSRDRLRIYANASFYPLLDTFKEDFPCTHAVLGDINFHNLVTGYLIEYPPTEPSLLYAGRQLPDYLKVGEKSGKPVLRMPFVADISRVERATLEAFHAADAEALGGTSLRAVAPESWATLRIRLHPAAQILDLGWRVDAVMTAIKEGQQWEPPEAAPTMILVWRQARQEWQVRYRALGPGERAGLKAAARGTDFASVCAAIADELESTAGEIDLPAIISRMLTGWVREGILTNDNDKHS
jgi:hypothetical protein